MVKTPEGMRGGSLAGMQAKFEAVTEYTRMLETKVAALKEAPFDPQVVPFLMTPKEIVEK